jgi:hypothetical protein
VVTSNTERQPEPLERIAMRNTIAAVSLLALAFTASPALADERSGLTLGLRAAYGLPLGEAGDGSNLNELTKGAVPVQLEAGWRFDEHWLAGAYFAWGPTFVANDAKDALAAQGARDVSGHFEQRVGVQGIYTILPGERFAPWVGVGAGYEWTRYADATVASGETELGLRGLEAMLQVGGDYALTPKFSVGPFASFNVGQYRSHVSWVENDGSTTTTVNEKGVHEWLQLGVRGTFGL